MVLFRLLNVLVFYQMIAGAMGAVRPVRSEPPVAYRR